jgi:peptide/nickel transport system substrate-binding protein
VRIKFIAQSSTELLMLQRGDLDAAMGVSWPDLSVAAKSSSVVVHEYRAQSIKEIRMNNQYGPTAKVLVRQALSYAWHYTAMPVGAYSGHAKVMQGIGPVGFAHFVKPTHRYTFDLTRAKDLLQKAGYGTGLSLTYYYPVGHDDCRRMGEIFQSDIAGIGVKIDVRAITTTVYGQMISKAQTVPDLFCGGWTMDYADDQQGYWTEYSVTNNPNVISDKQLDRLLLGAMRATKQTIAMRDYRSVVNRVYDQAVSIWTVQPDEGVALRRDVQGYDYNYLYSNYYFPVYQMYRGT